MTWNRPYAVTWRSAVHKIVSANKSLFLSMAAVVIASAIGAYVWSNAYRYELHEFTNRRVTEYYKLDRRTGRVWHIKDGAESEIASLQRDRKSTRLNSSHVKISYAVFCLKK